MTLVEILTSGVISAMAFTGIAAMNVQSLTMSSNITNIHNELNMIANDIQEIQFASTMYRNCDINGLITNLPLLNRESAPDVERMVMANGPTEIIVTYTRKSTDEVLQTMEHFPAACDRYLFPNQ